MSHEIEIKISIESEKSDWITIVASDCNRDTGPFYYLIINNDENTKIPIHPDDITNLYNQLGKLSRLVKEAKKQ